MYPVKRIHLTLVTALMFLCSGTVLLGGIHTIRKGETLYGLARKYKTSVAKLKSSNGIRDHRNLQIGQRIKIPGSSSQSTSSTKKTTSSYPSSSVGRGKTVVVDAGHGGKDWGAYRGGVKESYLNMKVASKLEYYLKRHGYRVVMTRRSDSFLSLSRRASIANRYRNAIFVSIHFNSTRNSWVRGAETFYAGAAGRQLASSIHRELARKCRMKNRGVRFARFAVLVQTKCPAVLVECGFISNPSERARCVTSSFQTTAAQAIAEGIRKYRWR
ncbi:MAG: N-acetylmuramoyl-L-alanine amidase [Roseibacillus sp.]|jgi:N-acetylmuramoyl-L-alanine amidase|nr:N-acetylmuramoyl-L-alanine amidase [Roseibacillus sp.]HAT19799.1 hypothetical protein [Verrucomicrobiales bacterium]